MDGNVLEKICLREFVLLLDELSYVSIIAKIVNNFYLIHQMTFHLQPAMQDGQNLRVEYIGSKFSQNDQQYMKMPHKK